MSVSISSITQVFMMAHLKLFCPSLHIVVVLASVLGVEVWEGGGRIAAGPNLAEDARVDVAHQGLANNVKAVGWFMVSMDLSSDGGR